MKLKTSVSIGILTGAWLFSSCEKENNPLEIETRETEIGIEKPVIVITEDREDQEGTRDSFLVKKDRIFYPIIKPEFDPGPLNPDPEPLKTNSDSNWDPDPDPWKN